MCIAAEQTSNTVVNHVLFMESIAVLNCGNTILWCISKWVGAVLKRTSVFKWLTKHPCHTKLWAFRCLNSMLEVLNLRSRNQIASFSKTTLLQRGPFLTIYTINLFPITRYHKRFYANNYFEFLPIVSTAFKDTSVTTGTRTHTLLFRNIRTWVGCSYPLGPTTPQVVRWADSHLNRNLR